MSVDKIEAEERNHEPVRPVGLRLPDRDESAQLMPVERDEKHGQHRPLQRNGREAHLGCGGGLTIEGGDIDFEAIRATIADNGGAIHSIDEVVAGKIIIDDASTPQDPYQG